MPVAFAYNRLPDLLMCKIRIALKFDTYSNHKSPVYIYIIQSTWNCFDPNSKWEIYFWWTWFCWFFWQFARESMMLHFRSEPNWKIIHLLTAAAPVTIRIMTLLEFRLCSILLFCIEQKHWFVVSPRSSFIRFQLDFIR